MRHMTSYDPTFSRPSTSVPKDSVLLKCSKSYVATSGTLLLQNQALLCLFIVSAGVNFIFFIPSFVFFFCLTYCLRTLKCKLNQLFVIKKDNKIKRFSNFAASSKIYCYIKEKKKRERNICAYDVKCSFILKLLHFSFFKLNKPIISLFP
jgi:hypothetical protein